MVARNWTFDVDKPHRVALDYGFWSGTARVALDGEEVFSRGWAPFKSGVEARFNIDELPCLLRVRWRFFRYETELWLDGKLL